MSIIESLKIGSKGLAASQLALNITGQNISNANTEGYSRKRVELAADKRADAAFGEVGFGVDVKKVVRYTDEFLELQIRDQLSDSGFFLAFDQVFERIENILSEPNDSGLNETMDRFWNAWQDLSAYPQEAAAREVVRSSAQVLADKFHTLSDQLVDLQISMDNDVVETVTEINGLIKDIFTLNGEVATGELQNGEANDSRDKRDLAVRELSNLIDVGVVEDDLGRITLTTAGSVLVGPSTFIELEIEKGEVDTTDSTAISKSIISFGSTKKEYAPRGGELKGIIEARDNVIPEYLGWLDQMAGTFVKEINRLHKSGYNLEGNTGITFFTETKLRAADIELAAAIREDSHRIAAAVGGTSVGPITETSTIPLPGNPIVDLKAINPQYRNIATGSVKIEMGGVVLEEGAGHDYVVDHEFGTINFLNYSRFSGNEPIDITFRYDSAGFPGPGNGTNALNIARLRDTFTMSRRPDEEPNQTLGDFYSGIIGVLGIERNQAQANRETRKFLVEQFSERKLEITGVSLDEELSNMIKFEHTYQASARYITTINSILDTLLNI